MTAKDVPDQIRLELELDNLLGRERTATETEQVKVAMKRLLKVLDGRKLKPAVLQHHWSIKRTDKRIKTNPGSIRRHIVHELEDNWLSARQVNIGWFLDYLMEKYKRHTKSQFRTALRDLIREGYLETIK